jgi:hypothetical protein
MRIGALKQPPNGFLSIDRTLFRKCQLKGYPARPYNLPRKNTDSNGNAKAEFSKDFVCLLTEFIVYTYADLRHNDHLFITVYTKSIAMSTGNSDDFTLSRAMTGYRNKSGRLSKRDRRPDLLVFLSIFSAPAAFT